VDAALADWRSAPLPPRVKAMLAFLETMTLRPDELSADDVKPLRAAGLSDAAIEDAIHVCALFNIYDRLADAFKFDIPDEHGFEMSAVSLMQRGYKF